MQLSPSVLFCALSLLAKPGCLFSPPFRSIPCSAHTPLQPAFPQLSTFQFRRVQERILQDHFPCFDPARYTRIVTEQGARFLISDEKRRDEVYNLVFPFLCPRFLPEPWHFGDYNYFYIYTQNPGIYPPDTPSFRPVFSTYCSHRYLFYFSSDGSSGDKGRERGKLVHIIPIVIPGKTEDFKNTSVPSANCG